MSSPAPQDLQELKKLIKKNFDLLKKRKLEIINLENEIRQMIKDNKPRDNIKSKLKNKIWLEQMLNNLKVQIKYLIRIKNEWEQRGGDEGCLGNGGRRPKNFTARFKKPKFKTKKNKINKKNIFL